jgi:hypothetical protein
MERSEILNLRCDHADRKRGFMPLNVTEHGERGKSRINATLERTLQGIMRCLDVP